MSFWTFWMGIILLYIGILIAIMDSLGFGAAIGCLGLFWISLSYFLKE